MPAIDGKVKVAQLSPILCEGRGNIHAGALALWIDRVYSHSRSGENPRIEIFPYVLRP